MVSKNIRHLFFLCALCVAAEAGVVSGTSEEAATTEKAKITPQNVSALYIGDLLRTKPKDVLEAAGSVHQPLLVNHGYLPQVRTNFKQATIADNYKAHGGHEYLEATPESRSYVPVNIRTSSRAAPVVGHLLSLKPVRFLSREALPLARNSKPQHKATHYENDDCQKGREHSYEERQHASDEQSYRREKQLAPEPEYRSPHDSYEEDDRSEEYSSYTEPFRGSYESKTHPSDTRSQSKTSGSVSQSKSTSSSKTMTPKRSRQTYRIGLKKAPHKKDHEKGGANTTPSHGDQGILLYKVKGSREPSSYSSPNGAEYPTSNYDSTEKTGANGSPYTQYSPDIRAHKKDPSRGKGRERPHQYATTYEPDQGSYEHSTYSPSGPYQPTESYHQGREHATRTTGKDQGQYEVTPYQGYQDPESSHHYERAPKTRQSKKRQYATHSTQYERVNDNGKEDGTYKHRQPPQTYTYPSERYTETARPKVESPAPNYESYVSQSPTPSDSVSPSYHRSQSSPRQSGDKETHPYIYETATQLEENRNQHLSGQTRKYHDSPRYTRSPERYLSPASTEERSVLPAKSNQPLILVSRESKPYISHSVSYSNSDGVSKMKYNQPGKQVPNGRQNMPFDVENPTIYKPFNSEYPASYANDPHHNHGRQQFQPQNYDQPQSYEQPNSFEDVPSKYQDSAEHHPYDQGHGPDASYEDDAEGPANKNKDHHYISKVEGYRDEYHSSVPLHLDDAFFEKYGISKNAKVIVASALKPNLFVADGTKIPEKGYDDSEPGPVEGHSGSEEERFEPSYEEKDSFNSDPPELGVPKELPGSFDDLVDANPRLLRKLPGIMNPGDTFFRSDENLDDNDFHNVEHKGFVVSQGPREIVQQHGDGVSRILFNVPMPEDKVADEETKRKDDEALLSAASTLLDIIKSDS